jgi:hypothetical protein
MVKVDELNNTFANPKADFPFNVDASKDSVTKMYERPDQN